MDIANILKGVPKGTKLYSPIFGDVIFEEMRQHYIRVRTNNIIREFYPDGRYYADGECMLFPSRENRDWNSDTLTFEKLEDKFDITTLKPFDKVLVRDYDHRHWNANFYSYYRKDNSLYNYECTGNHYNQCIPYNDETKHLVGTDKDCPEYYKTW